VLEVTDVRVDGIAEPGVEFVDGDDAPEAAAEVEAAEVEAVEAASPHTSQ
jgi:hypothetical protein